MIEETFTNVRLFTIGHSDHEMAEFLTILKRHDITAVADVRSQPFSRFHSQFNRDSFTESLNAEDIKYIFLGRELGARRSERECYRDGQARYDRIARLPNFVKGIDRIRLGSQSHRIALVCAEKDPITCHRMILICRHLRDAPFEIQHIMYDGTIETTKQAEERLLDRVGLPSTHLFRSRDELIEEAYDIQADRIEYKEGESAHAASGASA